MEFLLLDEARHIVWIAGSDERVLSADGRRRRGREDDRPFGRPNSLSRLGPILIVARLPGLNLRRHHVTGRWRPSAIYLLVTPM